MDCYYSCGISDFLLPKDEDLLDSHPSPDSWSRWGISATDVEFDFIDESFSEKIELKPSVHDKDESSSASVGEGLHEQSFQQTALSCDEPNHQNQDLSSFVQTNDIFLYKRNLWDSHTGDSLLEGLPCVENLQKFVPCDSESNDWLNVEAPTVKELEAFEKCSRDESVHEQLALEESILQGLETVIAQFNGKTRICFRDALYRLAHNTKQQFEVENLDGGLNTQKAMSQTVHNEAVRSEDKEPMESETNILDRAVANLMFNKMEINLPGLPLATSSNRQEEIGGKGLEGNGSEDLSPEQKFHYPQAQLLQGDAKAPRFGQKEQQTSAESLVSYMQIQ